MARLCSHLSSPGPILTLAEEIAEAATGAGQARLVSIQELTTSDLGQTDLVVMGSPTHYQNLRKIFHEALETLPRGAVDGRSVAAFDTSVETWGPLMRLTAAHRLQRKLRKLGGKPVAKAETFLARQRDKEYQGEQDLLYDGEIERARDWAASIFGKLEAASG